MFDSSQKPFIVIPQVNKIPGFTSIEEIDFTTYLEIHRFKDH